MQLLWERVYVHTVLWWKNLSESYYLEVQDIDGRIILRWIFRKWDWDMDWSDLAQDRDRWRALLNAVRSFGFP
jgi:hypothetical protein